MLRSVVTPLHEGHARLNNGPTVWVQQQITEPITNQPLLRIGPRLPSSGSMAATEDSIPTDALLGQDSITVLHSHSRPIVSLLSFRDASL